MCCATKFGFLSALVSMFLGRGCCPTEVPVSLTLEVTPAVIMPGGGTATLTATLAAAYTEDLRLEIVAEQTPQGDAAYELSAAQITIAAGQTQGTVTVTSLALPPAADLVTVVFRAAKFSTDTCSWDVDVAADALTIVPDGPLPHPVPGTLEVTLLPPEAVTAGARWSVGDGDWRDSGTTVSDLEVGTYTVKYAAVAGWSAPAEEEVTLSDGQATRISREYTPLPGALTVLLVAESVQGLAKSPSSQPVLDAQWRVDGGPWQDSGATVTGLAPGIHGVEFSQEDGWIAPTAEEVTIESDQTLDITRQYTLPPGSLSIVLVPEQPALTPLGSGGPSFDAQWRVDGGPWQDSGATVIGLSVGHHSVEYSQIDGWIAPATEDVWVPPGLIRELTRYYSPSPGVLRVTLEPAGVGGQWRVDGGPWQESGTTVEVVFGAIGGDVHLIEYGPANGLSAPPTETVNIGNGQTLEITRQYVAPGAVRVILLPPEAGGRWYVDLYSNPRQDSGDTVSGLSPGVHEINFDSVFNYWTPLMPQYVTIISGQTVEVTYYYTTSPQF